MSSDRTLSEFVSNREPEVEEEPPAGQRGVTAAQWAPTALRCQCGADITEWHTTARARELVRVYSNEDGRVPVCPACIRDRSGVGDALTTVPKAIVHMNRESSSERMDSDKRLEVMLREVDS